MSMIPAFETLPQLGAVRWICRLALLAALVPLSGCGPDRLSTGSIVSDQDYRVRHPIVLAEAPNNLDLFVAGAGLDGPSLGRIREFAANYHDTGRGPITMALPQNQDTRRNARATVAVIRGALAGAGASAAVHVTSYPIADPSLASPVRLSFVGLQAKVASRCGEWPQDLSSGSTTDGWENQPWWNMGCTYQSTIAAQVADPRDLVGPRAQGPSDVEMRTRAITDVRQGKDPGTTWVIHNTDISSVGAQ